VAVIVAELQDGYLALGVKLSNVVSVVSALAERDRATAARTRTGTRAERSFIFFDAKAGQFNRILRIKSPRICTIMQKLDKTGSNMKWGQERKLQNPNSKLQRKSKPPGSPDILFGI
jgi:hypothetical protein